MKNLLIIFIFAISIGGCASGKYYIPPKSPASEIAILHGTTTTSSEGFTDLNYYVGRIDGALLGNWVLAMAGKGPYMLTPGLHSITVSFSQQGANASHIFSVNFEKGESYEVKGETTRNSNVVTLWIEKKSNGVPETEKVTIKKESTPIFL